jgi:hypothetical protein
MAYRKGTKLIQIPINQEIYDKLKEETKGNILLSTVPKLVLSLILSHLDKSKK